MLGDEESGERGEGEKGVPYERDMDVAVDKQRLMNDSDVMIHASDMNAELMTAIKGSAVACLPAR